MKHTILAAVLLFSVSASLANGQIIYVDDDGTADFNNIQAGINAASIGDTVLVADGIYRGSGNRSIDFKGKKITVQSENGPANCIVDCEGSVLGFYFKAGVTTQSVLNGFTITNGNGILCNQGSPTITNCVITNNSVGIYVMSSSPTITNCIISGNSGTSGGMYCHSYSNPTIVNCVIIGNSTHTNGAGIRFGYETSFTITNCTITGNSAGTEGGGVVYAKPGTITNSIIWGNTNPQVCAWHPSPAVIDVSYSNVEGGYPGTGNMDIDPLLMSDGYHLQLNSPCVNSGDPAYSSLPGETDIDGEDRVINSRIDIGADELNYEGPVITISPRKFDLFYGLGSPNPEPRILLINNSSGEGILNWIVTHNCDWLDVDLNSGSSSGEVNEVTLSIDAKGLDVGNYSCELSVSDPNAINTPQYVTVNLEVRKPVIAVNLIVCNFVCPLGGPNPEAQVLSIWNDDIGVLKWEIVENCGWLDVDPNNGSSTGEVNEVTLSIDSKDLEEGKYSCELTVSDPNAINSPQHVTINLDVRRPVIGLDPKRFDFASPLDGPNPETQILSIWNDDVGVLQWEITENCDWLDVDPNSGSSTGEVNEVTLSIDSKDLDEGSYICELMVSDPNAINSPQYVTVNLDVKRPLIGIAPAQFDFFCPKGGPNPEPQMLSVWNDDVGTLHWQVTADCNWLDVDPNSGSSIGEVNEVMLHIDSSGLISGLHSCTLTITDPTAQNDPQVVPVALHVCDETLHVPDDFSTIQDAIDYTLKGGTVIVSEGTYTGPGNRDIDFHGKAITVRCIDPNDPDIVAATIIDCNGTESEPHRGFYFHNKEHVNSILAGFTIINGYESTGGSIFCVGSWPTIKNCTITGNTASNDGGGICCFLQPSGPGPGIPKIPPPGPKITNCIISGNSSEYGGGIFFKSIAPIIMNCTITGNTAHVNGGGIYGGGNLLTGAPGPPPSRPIPMIANCTVTANIAGNAGGAICSTYRSDPLLINNCILWGNGAPVGSEIALLETNYGASKASVSYCDVQGGQMVVHIADNCILYWRDGNIDDDPIFVRDPNDGGDGWGVGDNDDFGDLHLQVGSPCINAGDPNFFSDSQTDIDGQPRVMEQRVDMGADECLRAILTVAQPQTGDVWVSGSIHEIRWSSYLYEGMVDILFSKDNGNSWQTIESSVSDTGSYFWHLPDIVDSNQCIVSVVPSVPDSNTLCIESGLFAIHPDSPDPPVVSKWKSLGGNFARTGLSENSGPEVGCVKWHFDANGPVSASVTVSVDEKVHIGCEDGKVYTLDANGVLLWSYDANSPLLSSPSIGPDGTIYVGSESGILYAVDVNGSLRWTHPTDGPIYSSPALSADGNNIYVCSQDGILYALGPDGNDLWSFEMDGPAELPSATFASPAIGTDGTIYIAGLYDPNLYALEPNDGSLKWSCNFEFPVDPGNPNSEMKGGLPFASPVIGADGTIYQTLLYDSNLHAIEPNTGTIIWSIDLADPFSGWFEPNYAENFGNAAGWSEPALGPDGTIYVSFDDPYLRAVDPNGNIKWVVPFGNIGGFTLAVGKGGLVYAAGDDGNLYVVDANGCGVARFQTDYWLSFPVIAADSTIIVSGINDNAVLTGDANSTIWSIRGYGCEDLNLDETVNFVDLALLAANWLNCTDPDYPCNYEGEELYFVGDIDEDKYVHFSDLAAMAGQWLEDFKWLKPPLPGKASNPSPPDGVTGIGTLAVLSWTPGSYARSHDIYFGTASPGTFQGNQTNTTFNPSTMTSNTTYYWRIDEINLWGKTTGTVWNFRTTGVGPSSPPPPPPPP